MTKQELHDFFDPSDVEVVKAVLLEAERFGATAINSQC